MTSNRTAVELSLHLSDWEDSLLFDGNLNKERSSLFEDGKEHNLGQFDSEDGNEQ